MPSWGDTSVGTVILFSGRVSEINPSRYEIALTVKSDLEILDTLMPRNTLQPTCIHTLYDSGCTLLKSAFQVAGVVTAGSGGRDPRLRTHAGDRILRSRDDHVHERRLERRDAEREDVHELRRRQNDRARGSLLARRLVDADAPANGDTFNMYPGCDKLQATCRASSRTSLTSAASRTSRRRRPPSEVALASPP
jgi:hypothetical protein